MTWVNPLMDALRRPAGDSLLQMDNKRGENRRLHDGTCGKLWHRSFAALTWYEGIMYSFSLRKTKALWSAGNIHQLSSCMLRDNLLPSPVNGCKKWGRSIDGYLSLANLFQLFSKHD